MTAFDYQAAAQERNRRAKMLRDAAPDLLAALNEYIDEFEGDLTPYNPRYQRARAAIAKAKGVQLIIEPPT